MKSNEFLSYVWYGKGGKSDIWSTVSKLQAERNDSGLEDLYETLTQLLMFEEVRLEPCWEADRII